MDDDPRRPAPLRGRGTRLNPPNRFDPLFVEDDPEATAEEAAAPKTRYLRDASRTVIARNESPDVGFERSVNPYRGCSHGCVYCLHPDTPVLHADMTWRPIGAVSVGDELFAFDEFPSPGRTRKFRNATVEAVWWSRKPGVRLVGQNTEVTTTADHRWLQRQSVRWVATRWLRAGRRLGSLPQIPAEEIDEEYRIGYLAGLSLGDGTFRYQPGWRSDKLGFPPAYWRVALVDMEPLQRTVEYLRTFGVDAHIRPFDGGKLARKPLFKVEVRSLGRLAIIDRLIHGERDGANYRRGFLAGFFDAEGHNGDSLRISQVDLSVLDRIRKYGASLRFDFQLEPRPGRASTLRLRSTMLDRIRFFSTCRPAIARKIGGLFGYEMNLAPETLCAVEVGPTIDVVDIQTSTRTFFAAGLASHNCFARPTHEYLGFSAGLDFETKILVKEKAPELLRAELSSPGWKPQVVAMSGVTDPYQPVERKLGLTRRCLEVLAEFRNPVLVITKNHLVARDADLLGELARDRASGVFLSITTLDQDLQRVLEPRTSTPSRRLEAISALAAAGVPAGVLVAPVIPALTDHEIPAIVAAAACAGARFAGHVPLRLPWAVKDLFERWLSEHFPDRKDKVLNRIRSLRGGRLNDPAFGSRLRGEGAFAEEMHVLFAIACRRAGIADGRIELSTAAFRRPGGRQLGLFQ